MANAAKSGAVIFGFDVGLHPPIEKKTSPEGVCIRLHKQINRFVEDLQGYSDYAMRDQKEEEEKEHHEHLHHMDHCKKLQPDVFGQAHVTHIY